MPIVSLHVHERIDPRSIVEAVRRRNGAEAQPSLFAAPEENRPIRQAIEFYRHRHNWTNRVIAGDSLLVMNSLTEKEGMAGKVQMVYIDPPYGIRYGSNFQPFVNQREVDDRDRDLTQEPETLRAFRDTWELGIHSWLAYLRDRLLLARELLSDSGSVFVQIGDENLDLTASLVAGVFGRNNRVATISFVKTGGSSTGLLPDVADYLVWYAKDKEKLKPKYRQLYEPLTRKETVEFFSSYAMLELADGSSRALTKQERLDPNKHLPDATRLYKRERLISPGTSTTGRSEPYDWNGVRYACPAGQHWRVSPDGMDHLAALGRLAAAGERSELGWKRYEDEVPGRRIHNIWPQQMSAPSPRYVVETYTKVIERCLLMTTDPGDLALDITCGSGVTALVAEQWGRRWITCDSSRVAVTLARQRLMAATFDYYRLAHPGEGVGSGFEYRTVPKVSAGSLAYGRTEETTLYDQPLRDKTRARVTGPFTVEAVPAPAVVSVDDVIATGSNEPDVHAPADASVARRGETLRESDWRAELLQTGIRGRAGQRLTFTRLEPLPGARWLHADGESVPATASPDRPEQDGPVSGDTGPKRVVVSFGPDHAPLEQRQVELAIEEARTLAPRPTVIVFAAFQFDPEAAKDIDETRWPGVTLLKAQMNADLLTDDLKKKRASNESFWLVGQPDVEAATLDDGPDAGKVQVTVRGFDYYDTRSGTVDSGGAEKIALWMLDPDYDGRSLFPRQVFFPQAGAKDGWAKLAKALRTEIDPALIERYRGTVSLPFEPGPHRRAAVKIVDDRGIESLKVLDLP